MQVSLNSDHVFEVLCADVLQTEPFPNEIKVIGIATAWAEKIRRAAKKRGLNITINIEPETTT